MNKEKNGERTKDNGERKEGQMPLNVFQSYTVLVEIDENDCSQGCLAFKYRQRSSHPSHHETKNRKRLRYLYEIKPLPSSLPLSFCAMCVSHGWNKYSLNNWNHSDAERKLSRCASMWRLISFYRFQNFVLWNIFKFLFEKKKNK